ncbi:MAG: hypothetical protein EXR71_04585 [Myxococcales bacterium]|nr:hypothetical protein [Myxococcales bacterium]
MTECGWSDEIFVVGIGVDGDVCVTRDRVAVEVYAWGAARVEVSTDTHLDYTAEDLLRGWFTCPAPRPDLFQTRIYAAGTRRAVARRRPPAAT